VKPGDDILHEVIPWFEDPLTAGAAGSCAAGGDYAKSALRRPAFRARSVADFEAPLAPAPPAHVAPQPGTMSLIRTLMSWLPIATEPLNNLLWALGGDLDHGPHRVG
jgi:hypothetical protein